MSRSNSASCVSGIYKQGGIAIWNSHTQGNPGAWLAMQSDGNLVIYKQAGPWRSLMVLTFQLQQPAGA